MQRQLGRLSQPDGHGPPATVHGTRPWQRPPATSPPAPATVERCRQTASIVNGRSRHDLDTSSTGADLLASRAMPTRLDGDTSYRSRSSAVNATVDADERPPLTATHGNADPRRVDAEHQRQDRQVRERADSDRCTGTPARQRRHRTEGQRQLDDLTSGRHGRRRRSRQPRRPTLWITVDRDGAGILTAIDADHRLRGLDDLGGAITLHTGTAAASRHQRHRPGQARPGRRLHGGSHRGGWQPLRHDPDHRRDRRRHCHQHHLR